MSNPSLPVKLSAGLVSIYGAGSINGITSQNIDLQFGTINQIFAGIPTSVALNQSVMFKVSETEQVGYGNITYFILPIDKIILIENDVS